MIKISSSLKLSEHTLWYKQPARNFNESLPLGNGRIGANMYGRITDEMISFNEDTLWSGFPKQSGSGNYPEIYVKAKQLMDKGKVDEAQKLVEGNFGDFLVQKFLPFGKIKMYTDCTGRISKYRRELRLDKAVHRLSYSNNGKEYIREAFVSEPAQVFAMNINCNKPHSIDFSMWIESELKSEISVLGDMLCLEGNAPYCFADYCEMYKGHFYSEEEAKKGMAFCALLSVKQKGGCLHVHNNKITVSNANEATIYLSVRTGFTSWNTEPVRNTNVIKRRCVDDSRFAQRLEYFDLVNECTASHKRLYDRCSISCGDGKNGRVATDIRMQNLNNGVEDNALYTLIFNYGKYLSISSSRKGTQPSNLQGIWNDKVIPPWNCNYTLNINTEMNYWPTLKCGLFECYEPLVKMVEELSVSGKVTARNYYNADGWVCHHSSDIWRLTHPGTNRLNNSAQWGFWNMASGWLSVMLWDYYRYTNDISYLNRIYPIIEGAAKFYTCIMCENNDGELILSPSTSPENNYIDDGKVHAVDISTAMSQEILFDLFSAVSKAQDILGKKNEYSYLANKLKKVKIQGNGQLCEWDKEHDMWDKHHRHVSHLYGLFPSNQFNEEQKQACKKVLESRGDDGTGWSLAWKINLWARLGEGEHALKLINRQLRPVNSECNSTEFSGGSYPNLLCAHPPFQIDGNFGICSAIIEMLVQVDKNNKPIFLPALPKQWKNGKASGIRIPGNRIVNFEWENCKVTSFKIEEL